MITKKNILPIIFTTIMTIHCGCNNGVDPAFKNKFDSCINGLKNGCKTKRCVSIIAYLTYLTDTVANIGEGWVVGEDLWGSQDEMFQDIDRWNCWYEINKECTSLSKADSTVFTKIDSINNLIPFRCNYKQSYIKDSLGLEITKSELNNQSLTLLYEYGMLKSTELFEVDSMLKSYIEKLRINSFSFIMPGGMLYSTLIRIDRNKFFYFNFLDSVIIITNEDGLFVVYEYLQSSMLTKYRYCNFNDHLVRNNTFRHIEENWYGWSFIDVRIFDE
ncbi:MAG: hypothetical protein RB294_09590 [Bacteroidales bacterium]|nr:hypothetical protein [Bacteroidales bacterium]